MNYWYSAWRDAAFQVTICDFSTCAPSPNSSYKVTCFYRVFKVELGRQIVLFQNPKSPPAIQISSCKDSKLSLQPFKPQLGSFRWCRWYRWAQTQPDVIQTEASLLEIADSGGLRGVRCRQGPVAGVSAWAASHATAAVSSQTSHSCRTGPLYSHHLCWSEGSTSSQGNLTATWIKVIFFNFLQLWKDTLI